MTGCTDTLMAFRSLSPCSLIAAMICACVSEPWPDPPPVDRAAFLTEHAAWRSRTERNVRDNWVRLAGLWLLSEERTAFGTDSSLLSSSQAAARDGLSGPSCGVVVSYRLSPAV